jgi:hypothetical protein
LDKAEKGKTYFEGKKSAPEVAGVLSNVDDAILFARKKVLNGIADRFTKYFDIFLNTTSTISTVKLLMGHMIDDMTKSIATKSVEEAYFDFAFLFTFDGWLSLEYPHIENMYPETFTL